MTTYLSLLSLLIISVFAAFPLQAAAFSGGTGAADDPYIVASAEDLRAVTGGEGLYFVQIEDIDLGRVWTTPLELNGTYDGGGHKITELSGALFSSIGEKGVVKNLSVKANITTPTTGIIAADNYGSVINCVTSGGIAAAYNDDITYVGGVVGNNQTTGKVLSCSSSAKITVKTTGSYKPVYVGGIAGVNSKDGDRAGIVESCSHSAEITVTDSAPYIYAGGAVGCNKGYVMNCSNNDTIKAGGYGTSNAYAGGIVGFSESGSKVTNCSNTGEITASGTDQSHAGGVIGINAGTVEYSKNSGAVKMTGAGSHYGGGVVGSNNGGTAAYCFNSGEMVSSGRENVYIGGVAGQNGCGGALSNCTNTGKATTGDGTAYVGGVAGDNSSTITNCGWLKADGMPSLGVGYGSSDGASYFTSDDTSSIPAVITAEIDYSSIEKGETAEITFSLKNLANTELSFSEYAEILDPEVEGDAVTAATNGNKITVTGQSAGTAEITVKANITQWYDFGRGQNTVLDTPIEYSCPFIVTVVPPVPVNNVTLDSSELSLTTAQTWELTATVSPEEASGETLKWVSSDPSVATVDANGTSCTILPVSMGATTITVSAGGGVSASCKVNVTEEFVTDVALSHDITENTLYAGEEYTITAEVTPDDATSKGVEWSLDDPDEAVSVVTSDDKTLTLRAEAEGSFSVTASSVGNTDVNGNKAQVTASFNVKYPNVTSVALDKNMLDIDLNTTDTSGTLQASVLPTNAGYSAVMWTVSPDIAEVTGKGKWTEVTITPTKGGRAVIIASVGELSDTCALTVIPKYVTSIEQVGETDIALTAGETAMLSVTLTPADATDTNISWESSDGNIASVDENGTVTAHNAGIVTITASANGSKEPCMVQWTLTITPPTVPVESISVMPEALTLEEGGTAKLSAEVLPKNASNQGVAWSSSDTNTATVDGDGNVTAIAQGNAVITVMTDDGGHTATCSVTVTQAPTSDDQTPSGGGGCSAGWGALTLLALIPFAFRRRGR